MIIRSFLHWCASAPASARAEGASSLASAYLGGEIDPRDWSDAQHALTTLADDPSPLVRRALALAFAHAPGAPHSVVTALANDRSDIAALVLRSSPVLTDPELVDCIALGDALAQAAIAQRTGLSAGVAAALAEVGELAACIAACENRSAMLGSRSLARMIERFGQDGALREAMLRRPDLDPTLHHDLVVATAQALARFVTDCAWMSADRAIRVTRDAQDQGCVSIAAEATRQEGASGARRLVDHLRSTGRLTPALILRAILCGNLQLFEAAMSNLSGLPPGRVAGLVRGGRGLGFASLYAKAGLPPSLLPAFQAAVCDPENAVAMSGHQAGTTLRRRRIAGVIAACTGQHTGDLGKVTALLRRFEVEAAREEARLLTHEIGQGARQAGMAAVSRLASDEQMPSMRAAA